MLDFSDINLAAFAVKLAKAAIAIIMLVWLSAWLDSRAGRALRLMHQHGFGQALARIRENAMASAVYYGLRLLALGLVVGMLMGCASQAKSPWHDRYDRHIREAVDLYWPQYPHPMAWKAQLYQESRLDPAAVSPVGARGLAQFMPATWREMTRDMRLGDVSPTSEVAIDVGAAYMARLSRSWRSGRPAEDRHRLAQAAYNAGTGSLLAAQERCGGAVLYDDIVRCLPAVTGRHSAETIGYVRSIARWRAQMEAGF